jgi:hypothetical protein
VGNRISGTVHAGIYTSPSDDVGGRTRESFVITGNRIGVAAGPHLLLSATSGSYTVSDNLDGEGRPLRCEADPAEHTTCP